MFEKVMNDIPEDGALGHVKMHLGMMLHGHKVIDLVKQPHTFLRN